MVKTRAMKKLVAVYKRIKGRKSLSVDVRANKKSLLKKKRKKKKTANSSRVVGGNKRVRTLN